MKKIFYVIVFITIFISSISAQTDSVSVKNYVEVIDTALVPDMKLLLIADRLYAKNNGLFDAMSTQFSKEVAENGSVSHRDAVVQFFSTVEQAFIELKSDFLVVDTIQVDSIDVADRIAYLINWQQTTLANEDAKKATSLDIWDKNAEELAKLQKYFIQIDEKAKEKLK